MKMNYQGFIGIIIFLLASHYIHSIVFDWKIFLATMLIGIGGVIYGDA